MIGTDLRCGIGCNCDAARNGKLRPGKYSTRTGVKACIRESIGRGLSRSFPLTAGTRNMCFGAIELGQISRTKNQR
jgi:hypothetical protein